MAVFALPVTAQPPANAAQNTTGQLRYPPQNQEPGIIGQEVKVLGTVRAVPPDVTIPIGALPGRRPKEQAGQRMTLAIANQILEILADRAAVPQIMVMME
jgi:hypothetical protein